MAEKKGRETFTSAEIEKLRRLIARKCNADRSQQKSIRGKMRDMGFYITDFVEEINSVEEFDALISSGKVKRSDSNFVSSKEDESARDIVVDKAEGIPASDVKASDTDQPNMKKGLAPIVGDNPKVLILGTLPGDESIRSQQYYNKAGNRFWKIIYSLFGEELVPVEYEKKTQFLKDHGIAIWDVLSSAVREGSLDNAIEKEIPNDLGGFLTKYPTIEIIAFNGQKAENSFDVYFSELGNDTGLKKVCLKSSSGANNQFSFEDMKENWSQIL